MHLAEENRRREQEHADEDLLGQMPDTLLVLSDSLFGS
jgi:hypothetical protein